MTHAEPELKAELDARKTEANADAFMIEGREFMRKQEIYLRKRRITMTPPTPAEPELKELLVIARDDTEFNFDINRVKILLDGKDLIDYIAGLKAELALMQTAHDNDMNAIHRQAKQLAEKDKKIEIMTNYTTFEDLNKKLAEKDKKIEQLIDCGKSECDKSDRLQKQIDAKCDKCFIDWHNNSIPRAKVQEIYTLMCEMSSFREFTIIGNKLKELLCKEKEK